MASSVELASYRIIKLDYTLSGDYDGKIQIQPTVHFFSPADGSPHIRCCYKLNIVSDPSDVFSFIITAEGIFDVPELPLLEDGNFDAEKLVPITDTMAQKLVESVEAISGNLGIPVLHLKFEKQANKEEA